MVNEQTPLLLDKQQEITRITNNGSLNYPSENNDDNDNNDDDDIDGSEHHLPEIPEGKQALLGRYDDDNDDEEQRGEAASALLNSELMLVSQRPSAINTSIRSVSNTSQTSDNGGDGGEIHRRRRLSSFDIVIEDVVEMVHHVQEVVHDVVESVKEEMVEVREEIVEILEEEVLPVKPREEGDHSQKLSALALAVLVFYKVSGGPFGCEPAVKCGGPFFALVGFIVFPFVWCLQEALVTAELGSAYPEPSGSVAWIEEAFGPKFGLICGYFHWVSGATDNAIYPSLFLQYLAPYFTNAEGISLFSSGPIRFFFTILMSAVLALVNYSGLEIVGNLSIVVCIISMSPFLILCVMGIPQVDPKRWFVMPSNSTDMFLDDDEIGPNADTFLPSITYAGVMWRPFINILFWNLNSFDVGASFAGEVQDPERVFPKAMFLSVFFVALGYIIPLLIAIGATPEANQTEWEAGHFTVVSEEIAGPWLAAWTVLAAAISNIALFEAEMSGDAYQLMGMADRGLIPKVFSKRSRFGTPTNGILVGTLVIFCLGVADFDALVEMLNFAYSVSLLMEFAAFIKLRITDDDVIRPFRIPLNTLGCALFVLPSCIICLFVLISATKMTYVYFLILLSFGILFHLLQKTAKHYHWWEYAVAPPKKRKVSEGMDSPFASKK